MEWSIALLLLVVLLALIGALRWDALRAGFLALMTPKQEEAPPPVHQQPHAPKHLHDGRLNQTLPHTKPAIHRSGRRG